MRVLITGGSGFVGGHAARIARDRGHEVVTTDLWHADVAIDILDAEAVARAVGGCDAVIHCAAVVGPSPAKANPIQTVHVNVGGTANVLEAARLSGARVVYLSTATLYGMRPDLAPLRESDTPDPVSHYDATKWAAEVVCRSYQKDFGVQAASVRTGFVYGPGHSTGEYYVPSTVRGEPVIQETGADSPCDFTYVKDLARGLVLAAEQPSLPEPVYNVTGGVLGTRGEFAEIVRQTVPGADIRVGPGRNPTMHLRGPCVIELAKRDFGYAPEYGLAEGIADWAREIED